MRYGRILFGIVGVLAVGIGAGLLHRAGSQTQDEDPGAAKEHALATAKRFLNTVGVPIPAVEVQVTDRDERWRMRPVWEVRWGEMVTMEVSRDGLSVASFRNYGRTLHQVRGVERTGVAIFRSDDEWKAFLTKLAHATGVPGDARMVSFNWYTDDTPGKGDANRAGSAFAAFCVDAHGYPFLGPGPGAHFEVDPQDGMLTYYLSTWDSVTIQNPPPATPRVTRERAETMATEAFLRHTKPRRRQSDTATDAKLGWIAANGAFGSAHPYVNKPPWKVRLAWVISFGRNAVYVDPYDGSILGGRP